MRIVTKYNLSRGKALIDCARAGGKTPFTFEAADLIAMVAAYIDSGEPTHEMEHWITKTLGAGIAQDMVRTFQAFDDWDGRGLWCQGPAIDDIRFTDGLLRHHYPKVQQRWEEL